MSSVVSSRVYDCVGGTPTRTGLFVRRTITFPSLASKRLHSKSVNIHNLGHWKTRDCRVVTKWVVSAGGANIVEVDEERLEIEVANRECPLIIDFFATWCGPCLLLAQELEKVAEELGDRVRILKIDCDKNESISSALQIQGLPTLVFVGMDKDKPALRTEGLLPAEAIVDIVQRELLDSSN